MGDSQETESQSAAPPKDADPFTIRGRFLIGRPAGAMARVATFGDLADACRLISGAYQRAAMPPPWCIHIVLLRHDGKWAEQLAQVDTSRADVSDDLTTYMSAVLADCMNMLRECNAAG